MEPTAETQKKHEPLVEPAPDEAVIRALAQVSSYPTQSVESSEGPAESDES